MNETYDFESYVVLYDRLYNSGRIFTRYCFNGSGGLAVPILCGSNRDEAYGWALLESRDDGVYAKCHFFETDGGKILKDELQNTENYGLTFLAVQIERQGELITSGLIRAVLAVPTSDLYSCVH